jgi:membrane fusion protein (multidrug efflux system)
MKKSAIWKIVLLIVVCAAVLAAVGVVLKRGSEPVPAAEEPARATPAVQGEAKTINVVTARLTAETVEETFTLPGTLEAWENLTLSLEQSGPIKWVGPEEGDRVKQGQAILMIDTKLIENQHARDNLEYDLKIKQLERVKKLYEEQLVSQREYDEAQHEFDKASANLQKSTIAMEKSTLESPIDGILDQILVDRGEYGNVGMPAGVVVQVDRLKVIVDVPEKDVTSIRVGQEVMVLPADLNGSSGVGRKGRVIHVGFQGDELTRTYRTKIEIDNRGGLLRPGMIVRVQFVRRVLKDVLVLPLYAVWERDGKKYVFVEETGSAVQREIRTGPVIGERVVVFGGLQEGENLIIRGHQLTSDGGPVNVVGRHKEEK